MAATGGQAQPQGAQEAAALEQGLSAQGGYSLDAAVALLRHYLISGSSNLEMVSRVLTLALLALPEPDFDTLLYMIPERTQEQPHIATLIALAQHLQSARYGAFWGALGACAGLAESAPGLEGRVRAYILLCLGNACQAVTLGTLAECLALDEAAVLQLVKEKEASAGWELTEIAGKKVVQLPKNGQNVIKPQAVQQSYVSLDLPQLAALATQVC